jgi:hypothetical protein
LVLSDKTACDAALSVGSYLHAFTKPGRELFCLRNEAATFKAAQSYAASDAAMCSLLQQHQADSAARVNAHWAEVQRKQRLAASIRKEIERLKTQKAQQESERSYEASYSTRYDQLTRSISSLGSQIYSKEADLRLAEAAPEPVIQPLPSATCLAQQWLFFLHMPQLLQHLARASFTAQQLLLPDSLPAGAVERLQVTDLHMYSLAEHCNVYQRVGTYNKTPACIKQGSDGPAGVVLLRSSSPEPPSTRHSEWNGVRFNPKHIDSFSSSSCGVWWPDQLTLSMGWLGSSCAADRLPCDGFINPFAAVPRHLVVEGFTEQLADHNESAAALQWAMPQYGKVAATAADRGNLGVCKQDAGECSTWSTHVSAFRATHSKIIILRRMKRRNTVGATTMLCWV